MIRSGDGARSELIVGAISSTSEAISTHVIDGKVVSFKSTPENTFLYALQTNNSVVGKQYYPISDTSETLFTVPFREAVVQWGDSANDTHYTYPKANTKLEGFLYEIQAGALKRMPIDGLGLSTKGNDSAVIFSEQIEGIYKSFIYQLEPKSSLPLPITLLPEKCTPLHQATSTFICGSELTIFGEAIPDSWYQGGVSYNDSLWEVKQIYEGTWGAEALVNPETESGRQLDIINLSVNQTDESVYFINKNDLTLWLLVLMVPELRSNNGNGS